MRVGTPSIRLFLSRLRPRRANVCFTGRSHSSKSARNWARIVDTFRGRYQPLSQPTCQQIFHQIILRAQGKSVDNPKVKHFVERN